MKIKIVLSCIALFFVLSVVAQDYIKYQQHFNEVDILARKKEWLKALKILDDVDKDYTFVFARHCMKSLQICCANNDSLRAGRWLTRCILSGIPGWVIRQNGITERTLYYTTTQHVWTVYDSLRNVYKRNIDTALAERIQELMEKDMRFTNKVNNSSVILFPVNGIRWVRNNTLVHRQLKAIIVEYGFPGERLIGLDPKLEDSALYGELVRTRGLTNVLNQGNAFFMLLHYFSTPRSHINPLLFKSVGDGLLPVEYYARISDYQYLGSRYRKHAAPFYVHSSDIKEDMRIVNARRAQIGLYGYEHQQENNQLYWTRKKSNTLNTEVIYE